MTGYRAGQSFLMESDQTCDVFGLFGPGVVYSRHTLQNFVDFFMRIDSGKCENELPFIKQATKKQTNSDIDQLADLDGGREHLLGIFRKFLAKRHEPALVVSHRETPTRSLSSQICRLFLFPAMQLVIPSDPVLTEKAVSSLSKFFNSLGTTWNGENDEPEVSRTLIHQMADILMGPVSQAVEKEICQLWINFVQSRGVIEDFLMLTAIVAKKKLEVTIDVSGAVESIKELTEKPKFLASLNEAEVVNMHAGRLIFQKDYSSNNGPSEVPVRRAAAHFGFLFVIDPRFGLVKIGTGRCSTVFTSLEVENGEYSGVVPQSMAVVSHSLLLRQDKCRHIDVIDMITLQRVGYFLPDGTYSHELRETEAKIPDGPFTGFMDKLYFVSDSTLSIYEVRDLVLVLVRKVSLQAEKAAGFETPVPVSSSSLITMTTNGDSISLFYPANYAKRPTVSVREFGIEDGKLIGDVPCDKLLSNCICFDETCDALYDVPDYQGLVIYQMPPNFLSAYRFPSCQSTTDPVLLILNSLPGLLSSRLSRTKYDQRLKYVVSDTDAVYDALAVCLAFDSVFVRPIAQVMYLHLMQFRDTHPPSSQLVCDLLTSRHLEPMDRLLLVRAVFLMNEKCAEIDSILDVVEPQLFIEATMTFHELDTQVLLSICNFSNKFISYAVRTFDHPSYSFLQLVTVSVMKCVFRDETLDPSYLLPILQDLVPMHSHLFLSLIATMLPLLKLSLENDLSFVSSLAVFQHFLKEMHLMIPQNALKDYAISHIALASEQPFTMQTVIDETPTHPYANNLDYENHYDFPAAVEITIAFDQDRSNTEANCDWLQIFTDRECKNKLTEKISGGHPKWKEIVTKAKHLTFKFHSDGSVTYWGYRANIRAKIFGRTNYTSPDFAYDVFRNFFDILLKAMKKRDSSSGNLPGDEAAVFGFDSTKMWETVGNFRSNRPDSQTKKDMVSKLNDKFGTSFGDSFAESMTTIQTALVHHLVYTSQKTDGKEKFVEHIIRDCPLSVMFLKQSDFAEQFSNLANLMLFYVPQGIPDSELDFLYKSLKGTKSSEQFVRDSLSFAENAFNSPDLNLPSICYAVNKASLAFQLLQKPNYDKFLGMWFNCLSAMGRITALPNSALTPTSIEAVLDFGRMFGDAFQDSTGFVKEHLRILREIPVNTPDTDIPVVKLIIKRLLLLKTRDIDGEILRNLVISVLQFNLPNIISLVSDLIDKFHIQLLRMSDDVVQILKGIGKNYQSNSQAFPPDATDDVVCFDAGVSFACAKAECLRKMLREDLLADLVPVLRTNDEDIKLAVLLVLSCRSFQIRPCHSVVIPEIGTRAKLKSVDMFRYVLETEQGVELILPGFNFQNVSQCQIPFERVLPEPFKLGNKELTLAIVELLDSKFKYMAFNALSELLPTVDLSYSDLFRELSVKPDTKSISHGSQTSHQLVEFPEMTEMLRVQNPGLTAYRCNVPISAFSFTMAPMDAQLGFCDFDSAAPGAALLFTCTEKAVKFNGQVCAASEAISTITVGYVPDGMRLFFIINNHVKFTNFYLPPMIKPIPVIVIADGKERSFDSAPVIDLPLFCSRSPALGQQPSHMFVGDRTIRIDSICAPLQLKMSDHSTVELLPALSKSIPYYYIEFAFRAALKTISLRPTQHRAFSFYTYDMPEVGSNDTFGLFINFKDRYVFVTLNSEILPESCAEIEMHDWIITFGVDNMETAFVNIGQFPFMFDCDSFLSEPCGVVGERKKMLPKRTEFVLTSPLPCPYVDRDLFTLSVFCSTEPKWHGSTSIRPCVINTSEKGSYYNGKIGFGSYSTSNNVTLLVGNDDSCTVSRISFPRNNVVSIVDELSANLSDSQKIYQRLVSNVPTQVCRGLSPFGKDDPFFLDSRRLEFFDQQVEQQKAKIINYCMLKFIEQFGIEKAISDYNLEEYLVQSITKIDCDDFDPFTNLNQMCYTPVIHEVFKTRNGLFEKLCERAIAPFSLSVDDFKEMPSNMICHSQSKGRSRITLPMCDAIVVIPLDTKFFTQPHVLSDNCGEHFVISDASPMFVVKGDTIEFDTFEADELLLVHLLPIQFASPAFEKLNLRFSIQFISQAIAYAKTHPEIIDIVDKHILRKLWKLHMTTNLRFFPGIMASWFSILFEDMFTSESKQFYLESVDYSVLIQDQPNMLTAVVCLLTSYFMCNSNNLHVIQGNLSRLIEFALTSQTKTYAVQLFRQFATEMLNPFRTRMPFPKEGIKFQPLLSSLAIEAYNLSLLYSKAAILAQRDNSDLPSVFTFDFPGALKVAFMKISPSSDISLLINGAQTTLDCVIEGGSGTIKVARITTEPARFAILVVPIFPTSRPHEEDLVKLHGYQQQLAKHWTEEYEALARVISHGARKQGNAFWIGAAPDGLYSLLFPGIEPCVARFRCCLVYLSEEKLDPSWVPQFDTFAVRNLFLDLSSVIWPCQEVEERAMRPMAIYLPTKNAKLSDFFFQLCQALDNAPIQTLLDHGASIQSPGTTEVFTMDTIFGQLTNDMFQNGFPVRGDMSTAKLRAYQAFGCLAASHVLSGNPLPVMIAEPVLKYAFGITDVTIDGIEEEMKAIRMGVFKIELVKPSLKRYAHSPVFCKTLGFLPMRPVDVPTTKNNDYSSFLLSNVLIMPYVKAKMQVCGERDSSEAMSVELVSELRFDFDEKRNVVVIPTQEIWMKLFDQCKIIEKPNMFTN